MSDDDFGFGTKKKSTTTRTTTTTKSSFGAGNPFGDDDDFGFGTKKSSNTTVTTMRKGSATSTASSVNSDSDDDDFGFGTTKSPASSTKSNNAKSSSSTTTTKTSGGGSITTTTTTTSSSSMRPVKTETYVTEKRTISGGGASSSSYDTTSSGFGTEGGSTRTTTYTSSTKSSSGGGGASGFESNSSSTTSRFGTTSGSTGSRLQASSRETTRQDRERYVSSQTMEYKGEFAVEERGVMFSLDDFSEENFDILDIVNRVTSSAAALLPTQIEMLSALKKGDIKDVYTTTPHIKQFHPDPFIFVLEQQMDSLNELRQKSEDRLVKYEKTVRRYEEEHKARLEQLNYTVDDILSAFRKLEKRVSRITHTSMSAGQTIEASSQAQDQARFAQFVIRCFIDLNTGDLSRVDPILTTTDEKKLVESGKLIQLLESISDELSTKNNKDHDLADRNKLQMIGDEEDDEEEVEVDTRDGGGIYFNKLTQQKSPNSKKQSKDGTVLAIDQPPPEIKRHADGTIEEVTIVYQQNGSYTTTTKTTTPDGVTTTMIQTVETVTTQNNLFNLRPNTERNHFDVAAQTISYLSRKIENRMVEKFRLSLVHKDYNTAYQLATVLYTFKDNNTPTDVTSKQNDNPIAKLFLGRKFSYYSQDIIAMMRIPQRVERKDLASARVFTIFFTRVITNIIDVLREQCQILPSILPCAIQTFEDIALAVFQSLIPRLMQTIIDHPALQSSDLKSLRTRATMFDLVRRAICEVLCMAEDLSHIVERRNAEQRRRALFSYDNVKSRTNNKDGGGGKHGGFSNAAHGGVLLQQLSLYNSSMHEDNTMGNMNQSINDILNPKQNKSHGISLTGNAFKLTNNNKKTNSSSRHGSSNNYSDDDDDDDNNFFTNNNNDDMEEEKPQFLYGYLVAAMQALAETGGHDNDDPSSTSTKKTQRLKKQPPVITAAGQSMFGFDSGTSGAVSLVDKVPPKTAEDIDNCFVAELIPVSSALRDNMVMSINSFTEDWFDKETNYLSSILKQVRIDMLVSRFQNEEHINKIIYENRSFLNLTTSKEVLLQVKQERQQWLQQTMMDLEPIDYIFRSLTGSIKRALIISPPGKRGQHLDHLFTLVSDFLYQRYLTPLVSETFIRFVPWGGELLKLNEDMFSNNPKNITADIPQIYNQTYVEKYLKENQGLNGDEEGNNANNDSSSPIAGSSSPKSTSLNSTSKDKEKTITYYYMSYPQQQYQLYSVLPPLDPGQLDYIKNAILKSGTIKTELGEVSALTVQVQNSASNGTNNTNKEMIGMGSDGMNMSNLKDYKDKEKEKDENVMLGNLKKVGNSIKDAAEKSVALAQNTIHKQPEKQVDFNQFSHLPLSQQVTLTHDEIMLDLFFTLTVVKACIDMDKRLSAYLQRMVQPVMSNLSLRSQQLDRLNARRGDLEIQIRHYLECFAVYVSYLFGYILKKIPSGYYNVKPTESMGSTTKVTTLWLQAAKLIESATSSIIASLSGHNVDDFLTFFISCILDRLTQFITQSTRASGGGGISQLGAPLLIQDLSNIQRPINEMGLPPAINRFMEFKNMAFLFFTPPEGVYSFLMERAGTMRIDIKLVKAFVESRNDYYSSSKCRAELIKQINNFEATLPKRQQQQQQAGK